MTLVSRAAAALAGVVAAVWVAGCAGHRAAGPPAPELATVLKPGPATMKVRGDDDARAAGILAALMVQHPEAGLQVLSVGSDGLGVARGRFKFLLRPRIQGPGKTNTLVVEQLYAVRDEVARNPAELRELCFEVNTTMRFLRASILQTPRGPLFVARSELSFGDTLYLHDLAAYLDELKHDTLALGGQRMAAYLK